MKKEKREKIEALAARLDECSKRLEAIEKGSKEIFSEIGNIRADLQILEGLDFSHLDEVLKDLEESSKNALADFGPPTDLPE